jgi:hypothetical protein
VTKHGSGILGEESRDIASGGMVPSLICGQSNRNITSLSNVLLRSNSLNAWGYKYTFPPMLKHAGAMLRIGEEMACITWLPRRLSRATTPSVKASGI